MSAPWRGFVLPAPLLARQVEDQPGNHPDAWGLCTCPCLCYNGGSSPDGRCPDCRGGKHGGYR